MIRRIPCATCGEPYDKPDDDPDPSHPSCAPRDPERYEAATSPEPAGPRVYGNGTLLAWWFRCGCGSRVEAGSFVRMRDTAAGVRWGCPDCSAADAPRGPLSAPVGAEPALSRVPGTPAERRERHGDETNAPRRAAA